MNKVTIGIPSLAVVMPCLNEEENVLYAAEATLQAFNHYSINGELIIINDGSTDRTIEVISKIQQMHPGVKILEHEEPLGIGACFWHGVKISKKDYITIIPGDNENDPFEVLKNFYLAKDVDIIVPFIHNVEIRSYVRRLVSSVYRFIINISFGCNLNYTNGAVIYNIEILKDHVLKSKGFFYQTELLVHLIRAGYLYAEIPQMLAVRGSGKSNALTFKSLFNIIKGYLRLAYDVHIKRILGKTDYKINQLSATYRRCNKSSGDV